MTKVEKVKQQYVADVQAMSSKSRFGYFSLLPSHTAAITDLPPSKAYREQDGRVHTQPRNIFSGVTSSGNLKKNYFSSIPSAFHGSPYEDPGKHQRLLKLQEQKKTLNKDIYKPASLNKTIIKASYEYKPQFDPKKQKKNHRNSDGKVITQPPNVATSPQSKIEFGKVKKFRYMQKTLDNVNATVETIKSKTAEQKGSEQPFKLGSPSKQLFSSNVQVYFDANIKKTDTKLLKHKIIDHEGPFKPSCISPDKLFTPLQYKQEGNGKPEPKLITKQNKADRQAFKLTKIQHNSKPTPSISLSKTNLLRGYR